jgi:hypothetical protein
MNKDWPSAGTDEMLVVSHVQLVALAAALHDAHTASHSRESAIMTLNPALPANDAGMTMPSCTGVPTVKGDELTS